MAARVFSDEELEALRSFPAIGKDELIRYFRPLAPCRPAQAPLSPDRTAYVV